MQSTVTINVDISQSALEVANVMSRSMASSMMEGTCVGFKDLKGCGKHHVGEFKAVPVSDFKTFPGLVVSKVLGFPSGIVFRIKPHLAKGGYACPMSGLAEKDKLFYGRDVTHHYIQAMDAVARPSR